MGGSLGSVEGEKIVRAVNRAIEKKTSSYYSISIRWCKNARINFFFDANGKTSAALKKLDSYKLPYISILTDPTMGGVSASFAF